MVCNNCNSQQPEGSKFCSNCGAAIEPAAATQPQQPARPALRQGRGGVILTLGILALVLTGPITGIPAWVMGHSDMKSINAGLIDQSERGLTTAGMVLGIIGTCLGALVLIGIFIVILVSLIGLSEM
ncbi:MAG TPA: zinc ribbon domain-containing protein [Bacteroidota bacterium]|jgi:hypothetical protein|nr:zinc ribbon domain-containing protein [Bacteroidota bacterium]